AQVIQNCLHDFHIVEYYLMDDPEGLLMVDAAGKTYMLLVLTENMLCSYAEIAFDENAPVEELSQLRKGSSIPYLPGKMKKLSNRQDDWSSCLYEAEFFSGSLDKYYYAVLEQPLGINRRNIFSHNQFLEESRSEDIMKLHPELIYHSGHDLVVPIS
ncbi:MAG: hypothetical protein QM520_02670, partial [Gammaproteobacteria bacterium]|nr:hypothetical protein [Gammaproteobacteria bacterium]